MYLQASRCYYHPERGAVATCAKCGVGICKSCAVKDPQGRIVCYQCGNEALKEEHREYRKWLKERGGTFSTGKDFIVPGIIGIIINVVIGIISLYNGINITSDSIYVDFAARIFLFYYFFSIPFCYILINNLFAGKYDTISNIIGLLLSKRKEKPNPYSS